MEDRPAHSDLLTTRQVADELGRPVREVRKMINLGVLRGLRVGRAIRVPRSAVDELLARGETA